MEVRTVQKTGGTSFAITLPKEWVVAQGLRPGDSVGITAESDGALRVVRLQGSAEETRHILIQAGALTGDPLARRIVGAYLAGFDTIRIAEEPALTNAQKDTIRRIGKRLVGPEIVEETKAAIVLEDFLDPKVFNLPKGLKRMHILVQGMVSDALALIGTPDAAALEDIRNRDEEVDKLYWLVLRQYYLILRDPVLGQRIGLDPKRALGHLLAARLLERIGNQASLIGGRAQALDGAAIPPSLLSKTREFGRAALGSLDEAFQALLSHDLGLADHAIGMTQSMRDLQGTAFRPAANLSSAVGIPLAFLIESVERVAANAADIAAVAINAHMREAPDAKPADEATGTRSQTEN